MNEHLHRRLARLNRQRLQPGMADAQWRAGLREQSALRELEGAFVEAERAALTEQLDALPSGADAFMNWFENLAETGPGQDDPLFRWLADSASLSQMRWFITQEIAGEAGFDDLVALTQLGLPRQAKLELARNYWDEMGRGNEDGMHGPMLEETARALNLKPEYANTVWAALALANLMLALASNRRYAWQSIGALGAVEMTAPGRVGLVNDGLKRLGVPTQARRYFQLHAGLDVQHSLCWNREVIRPLVSADPSLARPIAEGALLRLRFGARCFAQYRDELWMDPAASPAVMARNAA
ncbi:iron-containing redox enzyme family protein [Methyloversatilis sp. RAC08]|uniref:iron-containing redox enzyme family protein n=1 Tax=Methyloversatilis sp. RAC08 TaxID=1842540 RepID=UPI00083D203E|nr:iron-containing redox enzyme family protein [Methyloversatilis sp. RAC08]